MTRLGVTGGSGKLGRAVVCDLIERGYDVINLDRTAPTEHVEVFIIANADTAMSRPNRELLAGEFPGVEVRGDVGDHSTLLEIDKVRRLLGLEPEHSCRIAGPAQPAVPD